MAGSAANTKQALAFVQTLGRYLTDFNFLVVKDGGTVSLLNQVTGESQSFQDGEFPIVFKQLPASTLVKPTDLFKTSGPLEEGELLSESLEFNTPLEPTDDQSPEYPAPTPTPVASLPPPSSLSPLLLVEPDRSGLHFVLETPVAANQQRERIAICPPSSYIRLVWRSGPPPHSPDLVVTEIRSWGCPPEYSFHQQATIDSWPFTAQSLEVRPKTPDLLSNNVDKDCELPTGETGFFFHFKIFSFDATACSYRLLDEVTSSVFRTVSHSKLCDSKRRLSLSKKKRRSRPRQSRHSASESDDGYNPY